MARGAGDKVAIGERGQGWLRVAAAVGSAGALLLSAAFVRWLSLGTAAPPTTNYSPAWLVAGGLALLGAAAVVGGGGEGLAHDRPPDRASLIIAVALPSFAAVVCLAAERWLISGASPTLRSIVLAAPVAAVLGVMVLWLAARQPAKEGVLIRPGLERLLAAAIVAGFAVAVVVLRLQHGAAFGWDESVYALAARTAVEHTPASGWAIYRPPGLSVIGVMPAMLGADETGFRLAALPFSLLAVAATWLLGRAIHGPITGLVSAVIVASGTQIVLSAGLFLDDLPSTAWLLLLAALVWTTMERGEVGWSIVWAAPMAALAFYFRYGSLVPIGLIAVATIGIWPQVVRAGVRKVLAAAALLAVLLLPHAIWATLVTGRPWGVILAAGGAPPGAFVGEALVAYVAWLPGPLVGPLAGAAAGLGVVAVAGAAGRIARARRSDRLTRGLVFLAIPGLAQVVILGLLVHPESRYVFFAVALLVVAGTMLAAEGLRHLPSFRRELAICLGGALLLYGLSTYESERAITAQLDQTYAWVRDLGGYIHAHSPGACYVVAADVPQISWYSTCRTDAFSSAAIDEYLRPSAEARWLFVRGDGRLQPDAAVMADYLRRIGGSAAMPVVDADGDVRGELYWIADSVGS